MPIITHDDAKKFLKIQKVDSPDDLVLVPLVDEIGAAIESHCNRSFNSEPRTEYYGGSGARVLVLKARPITALASVDEIDEDGNETPVATTEFRRDDPGGIIRYKGGAFTRGWQNWKIVYTAGYTAATMPKDLQLAAKMWLAVIFQKANKSLFGASSSNLGDQSINYDLSEIPDDVKKLLRKYKKPAYG